MVARFALVVHRDTWEIGCLPLDLVPEAERSGRVLVFATEAGWLEAGAVPVQSNPRRVNWMDRARQALTDE